jgi:hypothetical protein
LLSCRESLDSSSKLFDDVGTRGSSSEVGETIRRPSSDCEDGPSLWKLGQAEDVTPARFSGASNEEE